MLQAANTDQQPTFPFSNQLVPKATIVSVKIFYFIYKLSR